jgi:hypothetical protein
MATSNNLYFCFYSQYYSRQMDSVENVEHGVRGDGNLAFITGPYGILFPQYSLTK